MNLQGQNTMGRNRTREKIKEVARHFFNVKGFDETTLIDVTTTLNISLESLQLHFQSKDDLLEAVWSE